MFKSIIAAAATLACLGSAALAADPVLGLWQTEKDRKDLISHVEIRQCGPAFCGKILKAFNTSGQEVTTKNIGKELFWDVKALGGGSYGQGTVYVPLLDVTAKAKMTLNGNTLKVTGCKGPVCDGQVWTRLR